MREDLLALARTLAPFSVDRAGYVWCKSAKGGETVFATIRGWGYLTGQGMGALGLDEAAATETQRKWGDERRDGLLWRLAEARRGDDEGEAPRYQADTLPAIAELWEASWTPKDKPPTIKPRTQEAYRKSLKIIRTWTLRPKNRGKPMRSLTLPVLIAFLDLYDDRPAQRAALKRCLSALFSFAMMTGVGGIKTHPFGVTPRLRRRHKGKRAVGIWTPADVQTYAKLAETTPLPFADGPLIWASAAILIELMWETSADQTDVVTWRRDKHFRDTAQPAIIFERGKTGETRPIPISHRLAAKLRGCGSIYFVTDPYGRPYAADDTHSDNQRGGHFRTLQEAVVSAGGRKLILDHLRHSAITHAVESGASIDHVPSLSGHRSRQMIDQVYLQLTEKQALQVQKLRGIVE